MIDFNLRSHSQILHIIYYIVILESQSGVYVQLREVHIKKIRQDLELLVYQLTYLEFVPLISVNSQSLHKLMNSLNNFFCLYSLNSRSLSDKSFTKISFAHYIELTAFIKNKTTIVLLYFGSVDYSAALFWVS
jgi:hypothetical protein